MSTIIYGRNPIRASLDAGQVQTLYHAQRFEEDPDVLLAKKKGIRIKCVPDGELTRLAKCPNHQGFVALCKDFKTVTIEEILSAAKKKKYPLVIILDGLEDPHNLGAILRTADAFGADGVIMKKRGEVPLNATVAKVSTGAIHYVKVAVVSNLSQAINKLKENGYWIVATDGEADQSYTEIDYRSPIGLVVGSEGFGISRLVKENSDFLVKIPMCGHVNSLNASVAAAIFIAHIASTR